MKLYNQEKKLLVNSVFSQVYKKYDLMNDIMSLGVHRIWKNNLIDWIKPQKKNYCIDVASGTGDIAKLISKRLANEIRIECVEPNNEMFNLGKDKLKTLKNINWTKTSAEKLPFKNETFDFYIISFGIRNVSDINKSLAEAFRVLKIGGRFVCLEFSKVENELIKNLYKFYSKLIPKIGKFVVGSETPYEYLVRSIDKFYDQDELADKLKTNKFSNVEYRNLSNGIAAIHSAWKI
tara:strand:- start:107 stop:811 length:705 start_codon:yes stop_codon:yes gene_type:complete